MFGLGTKGISAIAGLLLLVGAVIAGVAVASGDSYDPVHAPQWQAGYSFGYDVIADIQATAEGLEGFDLPSETDVTVGPIPVKKEVLSTEYRDSDGQPVYVSAATFPLSNLQAGAPVFDLLGDAPAFATAERQSDLAPIPVAPDWSCSSDTCPGGGLDFFASNPLTYLSFPLSEGKRWEQEADLGIPVPLEELQGIGRMHVVGEVGGMETIDLGALGTTDAVRVDIAYTPIGLQEVLADFAAGLEDAGFELERFNIQLGMHEIAHYSPEYEAVVQQQYIVRALVDIALKGEFQGHEIDESLYADFNALITATLTGAERVAKAEMGPMEILNTLTNADLISDPRGMVVEDVPYTLSLDASHSEVNAAEADTVFFAGELIGVDELPEGHGLAYSVSRLGGDSWIDVPHDHTGMGYSFDEPGIYTVSLTATDATGREVAKASQGVTAYFSTEADAYCGIVGRCDDFSFDVNEGASELFVTGDAYTPFGSGALYLVDPSGESYYADSWEGFHFDADEIEAMGYGEYTVYMSDLLLAAQTTTYNVESAYHPVAPSYEDGEGDGRSGNMLSDLIVGIDQGLAGLI